MLTRSVTPVKVAVPKNSSTARLKVKLAPPRMSKRTFVNVTSSLSDVTWYSKGPSTVTVVTCKTNAFIYIYQVIDL